MGQDLYNEHLSYVQGRCPACGGDNLFFHNGLIFCRTPECTTVNAASVLLMYHSDPRHIVAIENGVMTIQHPLSDRIYGTLFDCEFTKLITDPLYEDLLDGEWWVSGTYPYGWEPCWDKRGVSSD